MRAKEFISESTKDFSPEQKAAIPGMQKIPELDNSNPYHMWRFIVAAGALDGKGNGNKLDLDGPLGQKLNTMTYSKEDGEIINATARALGLKVDQVSSQESTEPDYIQKVSPVKGFKGYPR
jgi:hypothetical protein